MSGIDATAWFDQFTPEVLAEAGVQGSKQWCARHWAPCPILGGNGVKATLMLLSEIPDWSTRVASADGPLCCHLGDRVIYVIWGQCPPTAARGLQL